ncbi:hypothetical protein R9C05_01760 [Metamycoplasma subdolum]|nr:hypothetical protein [Metamycoplasma subdolum]WPB50314.1 hypothetical protein R9C05_01760 [Metamycoplasma subdolum]
MKNKFTDTLENDFKEKAKKKRIVSKALFWTLIPLTIAASVGGAIYFVIKNSRPLKKINLTKELFDQWSNIEFEKKLNNSKSAADIIKDFEKAKLENENKTNEFKKHNPKPSKKDLEDFEENLVDLNVFIASVVSKKGTFKQDKYLIFKFLNIEKVIKNDGKVDENAIKITYEVFPNLETAEINENKKVYATKKSKFYFKTSKIVEIVSSTENWETSAKFLEVFDKHMKEIKDIIRYREDPVNDKDGEKWFKSEKFQQQVFEWFKKLVEEAETQPQLFKKEIYDIKPYTEQSNTKTYVQWNPTKGLNELTIDYYYQHKTNATARSDGKRKIFTILDI